MPVAIYRLISDYQANNVQAGETLRIYVPLSDYDEVESGYRKLMLAQEEKIPDRRQKPWVIIEHIDEKQRHAFKVSMEEPLVEPYREREVLRTHGHYGRRARRQFVPRITHRVNNFPLSPIKPRSAF